MSTNLTTPGRVMFEEIVPEEFRADLNPSAPIDTKAISTILQRIAETRPELYKDVSHKLLKLGDRAAIETPSSFSLKDLRNPLDKNTLVADLNAKRDEILDNPYLDDKEKNRRISELYGKVSSKMTDDIYNHSIKNDNRLAHMVASGARGSKGQLNSNIGFDGLVLDYKDRPIPVGIMNSYSEGLSPAEYWASSYGTRAGLNSTKLSTADSGYYCLEGDTEVRMADGTVKPIKDIILGDMVLGANVLGGTFPVCVTAVFSNGSKRVSRFSFADAGLNGYPMIYVTCTPAHNILSLIEPETVFAKRAIKEVASLSSDSAGRCNSVLSVNGQVRLAPFLYSTPVGIAETFDIEVDHPDHLFVLANGMIVSNSKQLAYAAADLVVTEDDCGTKRGIKSSPDEEDNIGSILARDTGDYKAGTVVTPRILSDIQKSGIKNIYTRSASTCQAAHGGLCAKCAGMRERGGLPPLMDNIGLAAASALGEPLSQGQLCLDEDTQLRMADSTVKKLKDIREGDKVVGVDKYGKQSEVAVLAVYRNGPKPVWRYEFKRFGILNSSASISATPDHKVLAMENDWIPQEIPLKDVSARRDTCCLFDINSESFTLELERIVFKGTRETMDIEVDHPDHLFLLANGMVVSNSSKHSAGVAGSSKGLVSGFKLINQLSQAPEVFQDRATVAENDGPVTAIEDAPQGGKYVFIDKERHYVPIDKELKTKIGDQLEAGDVISDGIINPSDIIRLKGLGQGRMYYIDSMKKAFAGSGMKVNRRNLEVLSRGVVNHVRITDPDGAGDYLPDEIVNYDDLERSYTPREGAFKAKPSQAIGKYLEAPALHYTIGTRITPRVAKDLEESEEPEILAHNSAPGFQPEMVRLQEAGATRNDWMAKMYGTNLKKEFLKEVHSGNAESDLHGLHPVPGLAYGVEFGKPPKNPSGKPGY